MKSEKQSQVSFWQLKEEWTRREWGQKEMRISIGLTFWLLRGGGIRGFWKHNSLQLPTQWRQSCSTSYISCTAFRLEKNPLCFISGENSIAVTKSSKPNSTLPPPPSPPQRAKWVSPNGPVFSVQRGITVLNQLKVAIGDGFVSFPLNTLSYSSAS